MTPSCLLRVSCWVRASGQNHSQSFRHRSQWVLLQSNRRRLPKLFPRRSSRLHAPARKSTGNIYILVLLSLLLFQIQLEKKPEKAEVIFETTVDLKRKRFAITRARVFKKNRMGDGVRSLMWADWSLKFSLFKCKKSAHMRYDERGDRS